MVSVVEDTVKYLEGASSVAWKLVSILEATITNLEPVGSEDWNLQTQAGV